MLQDLLKTSLFILSLVLATSLLGSSSVNAQSVYDDIYKTTDKVILQNDNWTDSSEFDITNHISQIIHGHIPAHIPAVDIRYRMGNNAASETQIEDIRSDFEDRTSWAIIQSDYNQSCTSAEGAKSVSISYLTYGKGKVTFDNERVRYEAEEYPHITSLCITLGRQPSWPNSPNNIVVRRDSPSGINLSRLNYEVKNLLVHNAVVEYPENYQGQTIQEEVPSNEETEKIGVSIRGSVAEDIVQVEWYNDPDNPKPDEAQGMYLVLHNINFDEIPPECSNQDIQEWRHSLEEIAIFNPVPCYGMWYVQSYYTSDPQGQNIIPNTDKTNLNLRIDGGSFYFDYADVEYDEDGSIISPPITGVNMADCVVFTESLPYVEFNYQGCFGNIQKFIGIAQTNQTHVSRQFDAITIPAHQACGSFTKFNNFLHISDENNWVCPQVTEELRTPITLFAVFLLYILTVFGLTKLMSGRI